MEKLNVITVSVGLGIIVAITVTLVCKGSLVLEGIVLALIGLILVGLPSWATIKLQALGAKFEVQRIKEERASVGQVEEVQFTITREETAAVSTDLIQEDQKAGG